MLLGVVPLLAVVNYGECNYTVPMGGLKSDNEEERRVDAEYSIAAPPL